MHTHKTLIVGGGMAGIGCAKRLTELGEHDFLLVTKDIGGRVPCSEDGDVNYGAYYVRKDYTHLLPYVRLKRRISISQYFILPDKQVHHVVFDHIRHLPSLIRFLIFGYKVKRHYLRYKKRSEILSQKTALEQDPLLLKLYTMPAAELVKTMHIEYWAEHYFNPLTRFTTFLNVEEITALYFIGCLAPIFIGTYEFHLMKESLIQDFANKILLDEVVRVQKDAGCWKLHMKSGKTLFAENVVIALPLDAAKKLVSIPEKINPPVHVHMTHLRGTLRKEFSHRHYIMFPRKSDDIVLTREENGSYLLYSHAPHSHFDRYFKSHEVIATRYWHPAFRIGPHLIEAERGDGLYLIGDYIFSCMEDAFSTGIFAAQKIAGTVPECETQNRPVRTHRDAGNLR